jgi:glycosyltransferase involved in cell wall biosynthesis
LRRRDDGIRLLEVGLTWPCETFLHAKFRGLAARGFRITVASSCVMNPKIDIDNLRVVRFPGEKGYSPSFTRALLVDGAITLVTAPHRFFRLIRVAWRRYRESDPRPGPVQAVRGFTRFVAEFMPLARLRADVVHFEWDSAAVFLAPMVDVWRCPMVMSQHGELHISARSPARRHVTDGLPAAFDRADAVHCVSLALREEAGDFGLLPAKAVQIPSAVDPTAFQPRATELPGHEFRIITVAWLRWLKGIEHAVAALGLLVEAGVPARLDVFGGDPLPPLGEPSDRQRILHTVDELGLHGRVELHGHLAQRELVGRMQNSHVMLHPSLTEGIPTVVLEAMACGLPIVATDCGGVSEAVTDGVEGFLAPTREPTVLAAGLERLYREPELRRAMGAAGRARVEADFSLDGQVAAYAAMYESVLRRPAVPHPVVEPEPQAAAQGIGPNP